MTKAKILIFTAETGHLSIAQALVAHLSPHYTVQTVDASVPGFSLYYPFYRYFPQLSQIGYKAAHRKTVYQAFQSLLGDSYRQRISTAITDNQPDLVISTYYAANPTIESVIKTKNIPFFNLITDPWTISPFLPSQAAKNFVFDKKAYDFCHQTLKVPRRQLKLSGWLTRPEFKPNDKIALRSKLHLPLHQLTLLVAAGSEGTNLVLKIIPTFLNNQTSLTLFVACGHNRTLYDIVNNLKRANHLILPHSKINIIPLKFTDKMAQYIQVSDLVIGKAGPNLLFETVACLVPFFAITHISGQEDGNLDLIRHYQLGYVEENPLKANRLLANIISHPEDLNSFQSPLQNLARHNHRAAAIILQETKAALLPSAVPASNRI